MSLAIENLIETKKSINETGSPPQTLPDYIGFLKAEGKNIITSFIYYLVSGCIVLYLTKLAFSGVIPTNFYNLEYTPPPPNSDSTTINPNDTAQDETGPLPTVQNGGYTKTVETNTVRIGGFFGLGAKKVLTTKIEFNSKNANKLYSTGLIGFLRGLPNNPKRATLYGTFFDKVFCDMLKMNNYIITGVFSKLYSYLSESIIIILAPIFLGLYFTFGFLFNNLLFIGFYITNIGLLFRDLNKTETSVEYGDFNWDNGFNIVWAILNFLIWIFALGPLMSVTPFFMLIYALFSPLFISGKNITDSNKEKQMGFAQFCKNVVYYKGQLFLAILSFGLLGPSKTYLGPSGFSGCVVAILFCAIALHVYNLTYNPEIDTNLSSAFTDDITQPTTPMEGGSNKKIKRIRKTKKNQNTKQE